MSDLENYSATQSTNKFVRGWGEGKKQPAYPTPPDPAYVADQQMRINRDAARMSLINQQGPWGSVNYAEGPNGMFTATTTLDPSETGPVFGARAGANQRLAEYLRNYGGPRADYSQDRQRVEDAIYGRATSRLDPEYDKRESQLLTRLENQGITQGSTAYQRALEDFGRDRRSAYDEARTSSILGGGAEQSRLFDLFSRGRGQEFGEIGGLFDLGRIARFTPQGQSSAGIGAPDFMGAVQDQYSGQLGAFQNRQAQSNANRAATTQLLGTLLSAYFASSKALKDETGDAPEVLNLLLTLPIRQWNYKGEGTAHIGTYAEEWAARFGGDGKRISIVDALGVLMKAIQELAARQQAPA